MSFGIGGGHSSSKSTSSTPLTGLLPQLTSTLVSGLRGVGGGTATQTGIDALTKSSQTSTAYGVGAIKNAFAASGMAGSTDIARSIGKFTTDQSTALGTQIAQFTQTGISDQLAALGEIISMASGSGTTTGSGNQFGFNLAAKLISGMAPG